jgi:hypothetical protein
MPAPGSARRSRKPRPSFYAARAAFQQAGLPGLLPRKRGPRQAHKLTDKILAVLTTVRADDGAVPRTTALAAIVKDRFGITAHPRSIERNLLRYLERQEKNAANSLGSMRRADPRGALRNPTSTDGRGACDGSGPRCRACPPAAAGCGRRGSRL